MIDFMVIGLPRSATTWAANFFTTDRTFCKHDPLYTTHYSEWDKSELPGRMVGIACTGIWRFPSYLRGHPAKKLILRRSLDEVNQSLVEIGLPPCTEDDAKAVAELEGYHYQFADIFNPFYARRMWSDLGLPGAFDEVRHAELVQIEMQPKFSGLTVGKEVTRRLVDELSEALR